VHVVYSEVISFIVYVMCSVLQGSVLGPLFFILYVVDLFVLMLMTHSCISISIALKSRHPSTNLIAVTWTSDTGCPLTN